MNRIRENLKKIAAAALLCAAMAVMMLSAVPAQAAPRKVNFQVEYLQTDVRGMLQKINAFRTGSDAWYWDSTDTQKVKVTGLSPLQYDYALEKVAMQRCAEIALSYSHTRPNGNSCFTAYDEAGYVWNRCGENIAAGYRTSDAVFVGWREDDDPYAGQGHRRNMLNSGFTRVGIAGCYVNGTYYWVQEFAASNMSNTTTPANDSLTAVSVIVDDTDLTTTITTSPASITLEEGETVSLPSAEAHVRGADCWVQFYGDDNGPASSDAVSWSVGNSSVASVSGGKITGVAVGTTTLKASLYNGSKNVTVTVVPHTHKTVSTITKATLTKKGKITYTCSICGQVTKTTTIGYPEKFELSATSFVYDGTQKNPTVTITNCYGNTISSKYYTVTKSTGRTNVGKYTYTIKFKERYTGTKELTFTIKPRKGAITSLTPYTGKVTLKALRPVAETGGKYYQIAYRVKGTTTWTYLVTSYQKKSITDLKSKKTYEFKERPYKTVNGVKYYGSWSSIKSCTVK